MLQVTQTLYDYMRLGMSHHLLNFQCFDNWDHHLESLPLLLNDPRFQVVDLFIPDIAGMREKEVELIKQSDKETVYNGSFMLPDVRFNPHSLVKEERKDILDAWKSQARLAMKVNASKFVIISNVDPGIEKREEEKRGCAQAFYEFAKYISDNSDMKVVLEPGDRDVDKKLLLGPIEDSLEVIEMARAKGVTNLGLMADMGHFPLLGESFEDVIKKAGDLLWHVHLGNCLLEDKDNLFYGDKHPPMGFPGGEHGLDELVTFLKVLLKHGYLNKETKSTVSIEGRCFPDKTASETVEHQFNLLEEAWKAI